MNDKVNLKLFLPTVSLVCVMCVQCTPLFFICICQLWQVALLLFSVLSLGTPCTGVVGLVVLISSNSWQLTFIVQIVFGFPGTFF
jgi:hypothetical protein